MEGTRESRTAAVASNCRRSTSAAESVAPWLENMRDRLPSDTPSNYPTFSVCDLV